MKILLSAYACEPHKGSETSVGWHWALEASHLGHEVWVLTRENNRVTIEAELVKFPKIKNLNFIYYDLPFWARWWKKKNRGIRLYYFFWQIGAYLLAKKVHREKGFDRVHHITFVSVRQPSFMGNLGIPFFFGPVGGGEKSPWNLRKGYGFRGIILDIVRDLANHLVRIDPFVRRTLQQAKRIYVTSEDSQSLVPDKYRHKTTIKLGIGLNPEEWIHFK